MRDHDRHTRRQTRGEEDEPPEMGVPTEPPPDDGPPDHQAAAPPLSDRQPREEEADKPYDVGFKRPPKHSQFQPGECGRHRARNHSKARTPRTNRSLDDVVREVAAKRLKVRDGETGMREIRLSDYLVEKLLINAAKGSPRHVEQVLKLLEKANAFGERPMTEEENMQDFLDHATSEDLRELGHLRGELERYLSDDGAAEVGDREEDGLGPSPEARERD